MEHIVKGFASTFKNSEELLNTFPKIETLKKVSMNQLDILSRNKGKIIYCPTTDGIVYSAFVHKHEGELIIFPIPDPTLVHFHSAQMALFQTKTIKSKLFKGLTLEAIQKETPIHELYNYYAYSTSIVINLFTAIESFINQQIPSDYKYIKQDKKSTVIYESDQIFKYISFEEKTRTILPEITGLNFFKNSSPASQIINNLKTFRDEIIHTKPSKEDSYINLMKLSIQFDYDKAIEAVAKFMNHYIPKYVTECNCGKGFKD